MSFNMEHGLDYIAYKRLPADSKEDLIDLSLTENAIRQCGAAVVGLNEVRGQGESPLYRNQAEILAARLGMHAYFAPAIRFPNGGPYGNALLSKYPILKAERILIEDPPVRDEDTYYETRCLLKAELDLAGGLTVYVCHFGLAKAEAKSAVRTLLEQLDQQTRPCVFMGDLNLTPDSEILTPIYERLQDTAAVFTHPQLSCNSDHPTRKIDYIFASRDIQVLAAEIPAIIASDHRPHTALLQIGEL